MYSMLLAGYSLFAVRPTNLIIIALDENLFWEICLFFSGLDWMERDVTLAMDEMRIGSSWWLRFQIYQMLGVSKLKICSLEINDYFQMFWQQCVIKEKQKASCYNCDFLNNFWWLISPLTIFIIGFSPGGN